IYCSPCCNSNDDHILSRPAQKISRFIASKQYASKQALFIRTNATTRTDSIPPSNELETRCQEKQEFEILLPLIQKVRAQKVPQASSKDLLKTLNPLWTRLQVRSENARE